MSSPSHSEYQPHSESHSESQTETQPQTQSHSQSPDTSEPSTRSKNKSPSPVDSLVPLNQVLPKEPNELLHSSLFLDLKPNNYILDVYSFRCQHPVIVEILKNHPLYFALSETAEVPHIYLQQLWNTIQYILEGGRSRFEGEVDDFVTSFTLKTFRKMLNLPQKGDRQGKTEFDEFVSEEELCQDILRLGYSGNLPNAPKFKRMNLTPLWHTLFSIINCCLTSKHTGIDRCSISVLRLFHGIAFHKHYDYALLFWNELVELVGDKRRPGRARSFVPFQRFLQIIIYNIMRATPAIPRSVRCNRSENT